MNKLYYDEKKKKKKKKKKVSVHYILLITDLSIFRGKYCFPLGWIALWENILVWCEYLPIKIYLDSFYFISIKGGRNSKSWSTLWSLLEVKLSKITRSGSRSNYSEYSFELNIMKSLWNELYFSVSAFIGLENPSSLLS